MFGLQFYSIGFAHFLKQKLHSPNNTDNPPNHLAIVYNKMEFVIPFMKLQMLKYMSESLRKTLQMIKYR